ncbi:hypothetical protein KC19_4G046600 [Ceratodon purpureus]|uniref:Protein kinase domain-containing protein n=1 Tax=Ceratodon purpureus TaxID=3225 RepID=A0A8T0I6Z4_CERPU|nr:hypothetical protein KC19_4G046600 [Ceratodon purpureus]
MSPASDQQFNTWFPAIVVGLVIGIFAAALWDIFRRRTWTFASTFWPGVLKEVGLDHSTLSRTEVEEKQRVVTEMLSAISSQISNTLVAGKSSMAGAIHPPAAESSTCNSSMYSNSSVTGDFDIEAQTGINPRCAPTLKPVTFTATAYFPDETPIFFVHRTKLLFRRYGRGTVKRWKSSIILQTALPIDPWVLAEIGELAKDCMHVENRCTFQLGNWAILYHNAGEVHLRVLAEGDVPVNVEARWQEDGTGITMRGLYLNGAVVKVATKRISTTLRSAGPAAQGRGNLDELHLPTEGLDVPGEDPFIHAVKVVEADGMSLLVRSEASFILPPREKSSLIEVIWSQVRVISLSAKKMIKSLLKVEDGQSETTSSGPDVKSDVARFEHLTEHWKGVLEIELLDSRNEVLNYLQKLPDFEHAGYQPARVFPSLFKRDQLYHFEYWQRGLQDLNEVNLSGHCPKISEGLQSGLHISIRGGIKFLLGDFEGALQDFELADNLNMGGRRSTLLLERSLAKCMLAKYSEAMQDVRAAIAINPNLNDIQELRACLLQILFSALSTSISPQRPLIQRPQLSDQQKSVPRIPDLLTGDEWFSGESLSICSVSDDITTARHSTVGLPSMNSSSSLGRPSSQDITSQVPKSSRSVGLSFNSQPGPWEQWIFKHSQWYKEPFVMNGRMENYNFNNAQYNNSISTSLSVPIQLNQALDILTRIAEGMAHVHSSDLLHRNLKSANLLSYRHAGSIIHSSSVSDFDHTILGLGQPSDESPNASMVEDTHEVSDVFSFGMLCYEILTGIVPFEDLQERDFTGVHGVISGLRPTLPSDLNSDLKSLIENCLERDPHRRPSFLDIDKELRRISYNHNPARTLDIDQVPYPG